MLVDLQGDVHILIHRRICLTFRVNLKVLTPQEDRRARKVGNQPAELKLKVLSVLAGCGLLPYGRQLSIRLNTEFSPADLWPFNHHFQQFHQIQELSIYCLHTPGFLEQFDTFFANFVPTLRSLRLDSPTGYAGDILDFILQFPHLDDLTLKFDSGVWNGRTQRVALLPAVKEVPPFRGRLTLQGDRGGHFFLVQHLISLPGKRRFRFVDFECYFFLEVVRFVVDACSGTIETLSILWVNYGERRFIP